jgi:hypothetical protein
MNQNLVKIFDIFREASCDPLLGPTNQSFYNGLMFGNTDLQHVQKHSGYFGYQFAHSELVNPDRNNSYNWNYDENNHGEDIINLYQRKHHIIRDVHIINVFRDIQDRIGESPGEPIYQSELGRRAGIPANLTNDDKRKGWLIKELVDYGVKHTFLYTEKINGRVYVHNNNLVTTIDTSFDHRPNNKSRLETYVKNLIDRILPETMYYKWSYAFDSWRRAPYDFGIFYKDSHTLIGLIEVDGDHHYNKNNYFYKNDANNEGFDHRQYIDNKKTELADNENVKLLRLYEKDLVKRNKQQTLIKLELFFRKII